MSDVKTLPFLRKGTRLADKRQTLDVPVPELGYTVRLRALSIKQLDNIEKNIAAQLALMIIDPETGDRVYESEDEILELQELSSQTAVHLIKAAGELNGVSKEAMDEHIKKSEASMAASVAD